jgi:hypothetical protein
MRADVGRGLLIVMITAFALLAISLALALPGAQDGDRSNAFFRGQIVKPVTTLFAAAVLASVIATGAFGQTANVGRALVASNALKLSADTQRSGKFPTIVKELFVPYAGVVRVTWELRSDGSHTGFAFVISAADNCDSSTMLATFQSLTCDLRVVAGDVVKVSVGGSPDPGTFIYSTAFIRNVRVHYNVVNASGLGKVLKN